MKQRAALYTDTENLETVVGTLWARGHWTGDGSETNNSLSICLLTKSEDKEERNHSLAQGNSEEGCLDYKVSG